MKLVYHISFRDFLPFVMKHYGESLKYGDKFIYQSVPKILQFWLDFGANVLEQGRTIFKCSKRYVFKIIMLFHESLFNA